MDKSRKTVAEYMEKALADSKEAAPEDLLFSYKGTLYPAAFCNLETFQVLDSFEARSDDVILVGYPRNGTNWLDQVLNDLEITAAKYTKEEINERINTKNELLVLPRLELGDPEKFKRMKELPFRRIIVTHLSPQVLPKSIFKSKAKILLLVRNPKDTAVSYFHFYNNMPTLPSFSSCFASRKRRMANHRKKFIDLLDKAIAVGDTMDRDDLLFSYKGILYPTTVCSPEIFKALESFEARQEDVILAGYPKSGTNWVGQILTDLVTTSAENNEDETNSLNDEELEEFPYLEVGDAEKYQRMEKLPSRRVIFTHLLPHNLPESIFKNKAKVLVLVRNPKDVATSFYHFTNGMSLFPSYETWDEFFTAFMTGKMPWGSYFDYICEWSKHVDDENVMTITYEELKENRALAVKKIAEFFVLPLTEEQLQAVADRSSFQAMKENAHKTHGAFGNALFRKGSVSDWKNLFNEDQNQEMDKMFEERLARTKLGGKMKYEVYCKA